MHVLHFAIGFFNGFSECICRGNHTKHSAAACVKGAVF